MDLCLIAAGEFSWLSPASWLAILQVALGFGAVIFVHELGHFLVAKACGVACEKFYLGFDAFDIKIAGRTIIPRSLLKWRWGETQYGIGILPLGGYVKMLGQDDNPANTAKERERSRVKNPDATEEDDSDAAVAVQDGPIDRSELDPRSYQAKTVLQRMAIISAGVIMNLIFAVVFATIAFRTGVPYQPPVIGPTSPGGPAYEEDIGNSEVLKVDGVDTRLDYFPYEFLVETIFLNGGKQPIDFELKRLRDGKVYEKQLTPVVGLIPERKNSAAIGILALGSTKLGEEPVLPGSAASQATPPVTGGDVLVEVDGTKIESLADANRMFAQYPDQSLTMVFERRAQRGQETTLERVTTVVPPSPAVNFGIVLETGPITDLQHDSPAAAAGLKVGDQIVKIDGRPLGDPLTIQSRLLAAAKASRSVDVTIKRASIRAVKRKS